MTDPELIRAAIDASELSASAFARDLLGRDARTVRRWLAGDSPIAPVARSWLEHWLTLSDQSRRRIVELLARQDRKGVRA